MRSSALALSFLLPATSLAVSPVVDLSYTSYRGTSLPNGITQWLGVRYTPPPLGDLRFREPHDPLPQRAVIDADAFGPFCLGTDQGPPTDEMSEDCLFLNVFAPSVATKTSKLPVYVFIQGGGFNSNSKANNGSGLVMASGMNIVVVNFSYRVGLYGFLASEEVIADGSLNNGLKDQRKALEWVQAYISLFGGDPGHVVIGGASAGGQSVDLHITAYGGTDDGLFHAAAAESQSFSALRTVSENQFAYDNLVIRANCASAENTLSCLRALKASELQKYNFNTPFPGAQNPPLFMYGPTLDFDFVSDYTYRAYAEGKFVKVPLICGDDTNEGTVFTEIDTCCLADSDAFIKDQFPEISLTQLRRWNKLYPPNSTSQFPRTGRYWAAVSKGYGELRYICPSIFVNGVQANLSVPNWNYRWNVIDPESAEEGYGVTHTVEVNAIWGPENTNGNAPDSYMRGGVNYAIVPFVQAYWTSFIRSFDPNQYRMSGSPLWDAWTKKDPYRRLMFQTNNTQMETVPEDQKERCAYLSGIGFDLSQ